MAWAGAKVLRNRDDVGSRIMKVLKRRADLRTFLSHSQNEIGLRDHSGFATLRQDVE
jgi:hypothetical protein